LSSLVNVIQKARLRLLLCHAVYSRRCIIAFT
jgi:hypothetical protein